MIDSRKMKLMFALKAFPIILSQKPDGSEDDICREVWSLAEKMAAAYFPVPDKSLLELEKTKDARLSSRPRNGLRHAGIDNMFQLSQTTETELLNIRDMGRTSVKEIKLYLANHYSIVLKP